MIKYLVLDYLKNYKFDDHHRFRSWEHCYLFFERLSKSKNSIKEEDIDRASLHLAFYLASWGMYRGSSALLWKDYKIHRCFIEKFYSSSEKYIQLINTDLSIDKTEEIVGKIFELKKTIIYSYNKSITVVKGEHKKFTPTDTLITKIILGISGSVPAYDKYFILGMKEVNLTKRSFNKDSFRDIIQYYLDNKNVFDAVQDEVNEFSSVHYSIMKIIDMFFWNLGFKKHKNLTPSGNISLELPMFPRSRHMKKL
jgi:hypothetical protein